MNGGKRWPTLGGSARKRQTIGRVPRKSNCYGDPIAVKDWTVKF